MFYFLTRDRYEVTCSISDIEDIIVGTNGKYVYLFTSERSKPWHVISGYGYEDGDELWLDIPAGEIIRKTDGGKYVY